MVRKRTDIRYKATPGKTKRYSASESASSIRPKSTVRKKIASSATLMPMPSQALPTFMSRPPVEYLSMAVSGVLLASTGTALPSMGEGSRTGRSSMWDVAAVYGWSRGKV